MGLQPLQPTKTSRGGFVFKLLLTTLALSLLWILTVLLPMAYAFPSNDLSIESFEEDSADLYLVKIPPSSRYEIIPVVSRYLEPLPKLVDKVRPVAVAGINAGYFDPKNRQTTSYVIAQEHILVTPINNRNFIENPDLFDYLPKMLNRSEFRVLSCKGEYGYSYDIDAHRAKPPRKCSIIHSIQAGPDLFEEGAYEKEAFVAFKNGQKVRDPIGVNQPNARSAIGIDTHGNVILLMAAKKADSSLSHNGLTLTELSNYMKRFGAIKALALDGGSSSSIWFNGETYAGKTVENKPLLRPIKSAFVVIRKDVANAVSR